MDYTTLDRVKLEAIKTGLTTDDDLLELLITSASRAIDLKATGGVVAATDYFLMEDVADEVLWATVNGDGTIRTAPHKVVINSVSAMSYRFSPAQAWIPIQTNLLMTDNQFALAWQALSGYPGKCFVKVSYNGGLAEEVADLKADVIELATLLAARFYREAESGLTDAIGVAELGQLIYTKAWPVRFIEMLNPYMRVTPWRGA